MEKKEGISFNKDELYQDTTTKICYSGKLFKMGSNKVFAHCGYDEKWNNTIDIEMNRVNDGFVAEVGILKGQTFNICFKNENDEWDNNNNNNYVYEIKKPISYTFSESKKLIQELIENRNNDILNNTNYCNTKYGFDQALQNINMLIQQNNATTNINDTYCFNQAIRKLNELTNN